MIGEDQNVKVIVSYRAEKLGNNWSEDMKIVPVNFSTEHKATLGRCKMIIDDDK